MKRYYPAADTLAGMLEHPEGSYVLYAEHEAIIKRQAAAARAGMDAATAISYGQLQQAHRLNGESSPEALESERRANAILTEENGRLRRLLVRATDLARMTDAGRDLKAVANLMQDVMAETGVTVFVDPAKRS